MEKNYEFRQRLLQLHRPGLRCRDYSPQENMLEITDSFRILIPTGCSEVVLTAAKDLQDYLFTSMELSLPLQCVEAPSAAEGPAIAIFPAKSRHNAAVPASYRITVQEQLIQVFGTDDRGCAQGCYQLEDRMNAIRAPYLPLGIQHYAPKFSPRMVHSGYGQEQYPDAHLSAIAHAGMDAILVFVKGVDLTSVGYMDFNNLIRRAARYGLDVYAYSKIRSDAHPDEPGAKAHYDSTYGELFRNCPGFKGVVLVGESVEFPSKDPRVSPFKYYNNSIDGLPTGKPTAGWFPCNDYHKWAAMLQSVIYPHKPDADIVLWTYNWGKAEEADRLALIDSLPTGITLMATFEMFNTRRIDGTPTSAVDYTLSFPEAGPYFLSEARRAKERGIRLYTQANSAGLTWDFGVIPYEPFPYLWLRRYNSMLAAREEFGLCGVMESHHYGFWPSFISKIEKQLFWQDISGEDAVRAAAEELYGTQLRDTALQAWELLSRAMHYYPCTNEDQYGPFRVGPAYPFVFQQQVKIPTVPHAIQGGNSICETDYIHSPAGRCYGFGVKSAGFRQHRVDGEIRCKKTMGKLFAQGRQLLEQLTPALDGLRREDNQRLVNLICFLEHTVTTALHAKLWAKCGWKLPVLTEKADMLACAREMMDIARAEIRNAEETIPLVEADSRLGWEPSMEYIGDARHLRWKIRQTTGVLESELPNLVAMIERHVN